MEATCNVSLVSGVRRGNMLPSKPEATAGEGETQVVERRITPYASFHEGLTQINDVDGNLGNDHHHNFPLSAESAKVLQMKMMVHLWPHAAFYSVHGLIFPFP